MKNLNEEIYRIKNLMGVLLEQKAVALEYSLDQLPEELKKINYKPSPLRYIAITDGNPWLATNRAISLKNFLVENIQKQVGIPFNGDAVIINDTKVYNKKGDQYQYVEGTIYGYMERPPEPLKKYKYQLAYNFYELNDEPYIVITKAGKGSPIKNPSPTQIKQLKSQMPAESVLIKQSVGGGTVQGPSDFNYAILVPVPEGYTRRSSGRLYYEGDDAYNLMTQAQNFIQQYTDGEVKLPRNPETANLVVADFTDTTGGNGNYIAGKANGANVDIIAGENAGQKGIVKRTYQQYGEGVGAGIPGSGKKGAWEPIGSFQLTKEEGAFLDNMITLQPGSYQKIFDSIKSDIQEQLNKDLRITSLTAVISGYASADRATNRLPAGVSTPDHTYGGHVPVQYWIIKQ
jgi:hypothetical protein